MKLGLDLSLKDNAKVLTWEPSDESSCEFWYKFATGFTTVSDAVSVWEDKTSNSNDAVQGTVSHRPTLVGTYSVTFDSSNSENLHISSQVSLSNEFTIAMMVRMDAAGGILIGDNSTAGEFVKIFSTNKLRVRIDSNTAVDIQLDSGTLLNEINYLVLTRSSVGGVANTLRLYWNGVLQADTEVMAGTADIDSLGVRATDINPFEGKMYEVMLFNTEAQALTDNINLRLGTLPL